SFHAGLQSEFAHDVGHVADFFQSEEYSEASGFASSSYTALRYGLAGYATCSIDLAGMHCGISIEDPCHLAFTCPIISDRQVSAWSDEILLYQFRSIAASDLFEFVSGELAWVDLDTSFAAAERYVYDSAFVSHQRSKRHYFVLVYFCRKADTSFTWSLVL